MTGWLTLAAVLVLGTVIGLVKAHRDGRLRSRTGTETVTPDDVGVPLGRRATLVQFSSEFCGQCAATRRVLAEVGDEVDGVFHVDLDVERNPALVRRLRISRTPTVLVLDGTGRVVRRAVGQPRKAEVLAALKEDAR